MRIRSVRHRPDSERGEAGPGGVAPGGEALKLLAIAWAAFQPRTVQLAAELGGESAFISSARLARSAGLLPLRYLSSVTRTWRLLQRRRPEVVLVITPPVVAPLVCWLWCSVNGRKLVVDCHTGAFHSRRWAWARPLHRWVLRRASAVTVHTDEALALVKGWGAAGLLVPDDLPEPGDAGETNAPTRPTVLVAGSFDENEPVDLVLDAIRLVPEIEVRLTGDPQLVPADVRQAAPDNAVFTGFLPYRVFLGELVRAHVVAAFSTDPQIMNRAAFEAVGLARPLVLSELPALRSRFGEAAVMSPNRPQEMAEALRNALANQDELARKSEALGVRLREQRRAALDQLRLLLDTPAAPSSSAARQGAEARTGHRRSAVLMVSQHSFAEEVVLRRNVFELLDAGFDVDVICSAGIMGVQRRDDRPGLRVHWIPVKHRRRPFIRYPWEYAVFFLSTLAVASGLASRRRYVAVQVDNLPDFLVFAVVVPRLRGARVVFNMLELTPEMVASRFGAGRLRRLVTLARWTEAAAAGWADHVIVVSEECRRRVLQRGVPAEKTTVVVNTTSNPPGSDDARSLAAPGPERPYVVTHTTLLERYGVHVAIQAFASLQRRWPELTLRVIGDGEERQALERLVTDLGLQDRVIFTGFLPWTETIAQVRKAVVGIVAVLGDGYGELLLPTKLLEYARFGVPAVCSRLPVVEHYFPEDSLAYFAAGDAAQLAARLDDLLSDPGRAREQAAQAEEVARGLGWERVRGDYLKALGLSTPVGKPMTMPSALEERPA